MEDAQSTFGDERLETEHVAQECEAWVGRVGFPAAVDLKSFVSKVTALWTLSYVSIRVGRVYIST